MEGNFYAMLIGFDKFKDKENLPGLKFAEKDAHDLYEVLVDPRYGNYPRKNITLVTANELHMHLEQGEEYPDKMVSLVKRETPMEQMETEDIETILYTQMVKNRVPSDVILVYYSGHGFIAGKNEKAYLATPDVSILEIQNNPRAGLQMEYLHNDIFMETKAKFVIFVLDCCHSGAFCASLEHKELAGTKQLVEGRFYSGEGRVAFVSSPRGIISRESKDYQNGVFTYHLLNGLRGAAAEPSGEVTIASLVSYVQRMSPLGQPPVLYGMTTRIVLTRPGEVEAASKPVYKVYQGNQLALSAAGHTLIGMPLVNPLDDHVKYLDTVLERIRSISQDENLSVGDRVLSSIRSSLDAEFAFILRIEEENTDKNIIYKYESDLALKGVDLEDYKRLVMSDLYFLLIRKKKELLPSRYGFYKPFEDRKEVGRYLVAIPFRLEYPREFLVLCGVDSAQLKYGEILGRALISLYNATNELTSLRLSEVETALWDDLKRDFGHVPFSMYERRFELFKERLKRITFAYEPVVKLRKHKPEIDSWEALARDPDTQKAPFGLFEAAELWGPQFITELDLYCLRTAVADYVRLWEEEHPNRKLDPLSVNVYPDTLFRSAYKRELTRIVAEEEIINSENLLLEISEKHPIPSIEQIREHVLGHFDPIEEFINKIHEYTNELQIGFAIDDFGAKHSSVARLAKLELDHVKIDRDVLHHTHPEYTIAYVRSVVEGIHKHPYKVVVEGFDGDSRISLRSLFDLRIRYVQGHMIRRASPSVSDLDQREKDFIVQELSKKGA